MNDPRPLTAGVLGNPIGQSKSPLLFRHWFDVLGVEGNYSPYLVAPEEFERVIRGLQAAGLRGVNCTIPYKQAALAIADDVSPMAQAIGAANTLTFRADGTIHADNTDGYGFIENLMAGAPTWRADSGPTLMLGAGGAARAAVYALIDAGCPEIRLSNRTRARAEELADDLDGPISVIDWDERASAADGAALIANSTSLGMIGQHLLAMDLTAAPADAVVTDMVYNPLETDLLAAARARELITVDGLGMLLHQARPGFQRWFDRDPTVTEDLRIAVLGGA
ncbi:MAG: shikimate dehydrogenase [Pseudomonadota bacterium]